jgi:hypothetical protein
LSYRLLPYVDDNLVSNIAFDQGGRFFSVREKGEFYFSLGNFLIVKLLLLVPAIVSSVSS